MFRRLTVATILIAFVPSALLAQEKTLAARIGPLITAHKGKVTVAVKHLGTGETYFHDEDEEMPTASLIKFPVMLEAYLQAAEARSRWPTRSRCARPTWSPAAASSPITSPTARPSRCAMPFAS